MENNMWMTKEWRRQGGVFELLRRGLRNRSFPLEPAITTTSAALLKHDIATTEIRIADSQVY
jgi:hypothetical protein